MRKNISITIITGVLAEIDRRRGPDISRSHSVESVLREYCNRREREAMNQHDLELINASVNCLNGEMEHVLRYQALIDFSEEE